MSKLTKNLIKIAKLKKKLGKLEKDKEFKEEFDDCLWVEVGDILTGCTEKDGSLYDKAGNQICSSGLQPDGYYCNQYSGYCEDDYHGTMYYKTKRRGVFVEVHYQC